MIDSRKSILKPNLKVGDALVDTSSHTIFKVTRVKLNRGWTRHCVDLEAPLTGEKRGLRLFLLVGEHSRYHKL
jgi:hypothetical protein